MERNREGRRLAATNGLTRRKQRTNSLRDSPEEDGMVEMHETTRLRDRGGGGSKKERDRERLSRNKRRRREERGEESSEESVEEDEDEEEEDGMMGMRMLPPNHSSASGSGSVSGHHHRRSFPPAKVIRAPAPVPVPSPHVALRGADEMIGVPVPRKARTASAKRSHDYWNSGGGGGGGGGGGEQIYRQASISPARPNPSPAPLSPSSSTVSVKKKTKVLGHKQKPPKISKPSSSSGQDDLEIEVAEVLSGLKKQPQGCQKQEIVANAFSSCKQDLKDTNGGSGSCTEAKSSRVSSPVSNPQNSSSSIVPNRKKPRPENPSIMSSRNGNGSSSSASRMESEQQPGKVEDSSARLKKNIGSVIENGGLSSSISEKQESNLVSKPKPLVEESKVGESVQIKDPRIESPKVDVNHVDACAAKQSSITPDVQRKREERMEIDLMAPPLKSSPDRDGLNDFVPDHKALVTDVKMGEKGEVVVTRNEGENAQKSGKQERKEVEKKKETMVEGLSINKDRVNDLQVNLEKQYQESGSNVFNSSKQQQPIQKQQLQQPKSVRDDFKIEKPATYTSLPMPMTLSGWHGGLPPIGLTGQIPSIQGVVSMDGSVGPSSAMQPPHGLLSQPRPKRCATHYYIARNIYYHQQFTKMNPFWPAAAGSASLYGTKPYNLNIMPPTETPMIGNPMPAIFPSRNSNLQDKGLGVAPLSSHIGMEKGSVAASYMDGEQRKPLTLQQGTQPAVAGNMMPGPAFIFPISQQQAAQQAAVAAANRSAIISKAASSSASSSAQGAQGKNSTAAVSAAPPSAPSNMNFSYQNLPPNEAQYMAVLHNNGYPFPLPSQVGVPPPFRGGNHAQAMPFLNGSFYPQMIHSSQLQQQQKLQQPLHPPHSQPQPQANQNTSTSSGSSSSQKHQQNQQQRLNGGGTNGTGAGSSHSNPASKSRPQQQSSHPQQGQHLLPKPSRQSEAEMTGEDSSATSDSRVSSVQKSLYDHGFALPMHPQNALFSAASLASASGNHGEKQPLQQLQQQNIKGGELVPSQSIELSFGSFNGAGPAPGLDFPSMVQNHPFFQSLPEVAKKQYQMAAAAAAVAAAAQQKKSHQVSEEGKTVGNSSITNDERKVPAAKGQTTAGQSLVYSRLDSNDQSTPTLDNTAMESAARALNLNRASRLPTTSSANTSSAAATGSLNSQLQQHQLLVQLQKQHQQQQMQQQQHQMQQQQQQQQMQQHQQQLAAVSRNKQSTTTSANAPDHHMPSSMAGKFTNSQSVFVQGSSTSQSPQWKNPPARTTTSTPSMAPMAASSLKNHTQQQGRAQQGHSQISFGVNSKSAAAPHGQQQLPPSNQSASPPMAVGSPTHSISRSAGGSPRTTSTGSKVGSSPTLPSQQVKNSQSGPNRKSSPGGGRNMPSILGNSQVANAPGAGAKTQSQQQQQQHQQQQQQQIQKQALQQLFLSNPYMQAQSPQSSTTTAGSSGVVYYTQRRPSEQQQQVSSTSGGMHCPPLTLTGATSSDPSKAVVAGVANNVKGGLPQNPAQLGAHSGSNSHPLMSAAFQYMHPMPAASVKPAEQKQPAGNDNLHACWQPDKR